MRVCNDAIHKYKDKFSHPPLGKFYLVDSGYSNRWGYFVSYKGTKYHVPEFQRGSMPKGIKETFNFAHSSIRNVVERAFGVLKMKWRILLKVPNYPMRKQSEIIVACVALHNFVRDSKIEDKDFEIFERDETHVPPEASIFEPPATITDARKDDQSMNRFRDELANALFGRL